MKYDQTRSRKNEGYDYRAKANGRSSVLIDCPFCGTTVEAAVWSLAGGGKRCSDCGAIHYAGTSWPLAKKTEGRRRS